MQANLSIENYCKKHGMPCQRNLQELRKTTIATLTTEVDFLDELPDYDTFFSQYLLPNKPCLISSKATADWRSRKEWVINGKISSEFLNVNFGEQVVPVADCNQALYSSNPKQDMKLKEFLQYLSGQTRTSEIDDTKCMYLKDWHFTSCVPDYEAYKTPVYFKSDWLNEFWDSKHRGADDYRFVYIGPKGSWTPFHADVFRSFSWSANICGRKKWIFFVPGEERCLTDVHGNYVYDIRSDSLCDKSTFPDFCHLRHRIEVIQEEGEIIFVPSNWHHQVHNLEDTISINHNWFNGCNIDLCWEHLKISQKAVEKEISDCRDMDGWYKQCQLILKASNGVDYQEFLQILITVSQHRLQAMEGASRAQHRLQAMEGASRAQHDKGDNLDKDFTDDLDSMSITVDGRSSKSNTMLDLVAGCDSLMHSNVHWRFCDIDHGLFDLQRVKYVIHEILTSSCLPELNIQEDIDAANNILMRIDSLFKVNGICK